MPAARATIQENSNPFVASLLTLCLVLQWGGARTFNFDPSGGDEATHGTIVGQSLLFATNIITIWLVLKSPYARHTLRICWPILLLPAMAMISSIWSVYPYMTFRSGLSYALVTLLGFAVAGTLPALVSLKVLIRAMSYCCVLSMLVAIFLPNIGVHQATDTIQSVHAGYWRGIMAHKIGLGIFAGGTLSLLIFYGWLAFRWAWPLFAASAVACLVYTNSVTAYSGFALMTALLLALRLSKRQIGAVNMTVLFGVLIVVATAMGVMNWFVVLLDKSTDLTGRADMWPLISAISASNIVGWLIGYGYVAGMKVFVAPAVAPFVGMVPSDAHNGYLETLVAFGYVGAIVVLFIHLWLFSGCRKLLLNPASGFGALAAIPMSLFLTGALLNYSESLLMSYASHFSVLTPLAAAWVYQASAGQRLRALPEAGGRRVAAEPNVERSTSMRARPIP